MEAKSRVEIIDLGVQYRVRVSTADAGVNERTYEDPGRDCDRRTRFAAEFVVVSLLPPQLVLGLGEPPEPAPSLPAVPEAAPAPPPPAPAPPPVAEHPAFPVSAAGRRAWAIRVEVAALSLASPPVLGAPGLFMWGADGRVGVGKGPLSAVAGVGYLPKVEFVVSGVRAAVSRVPALLGVRVQPLKRPFVLTGEAGLSVAFEHYEGMSPHQTSDTTRVAPGAEIAIDASPMPSWGWAPFLSLRSTWLPVRQELVAAPQGAIANAPSLWFGGALGLAWEP
jgi:hypothetical protein